MSNPSRENILFENAKGITSSPARTAYVREACCDDVALRYAVEKLLAEHDAKLQSEKDSAATKQSVAGGGNKWLKDLLMLVAALLTLVGVVAGVWIFAETQRSERIASVQARVSEALSEARRHQGLADAIDSRRDRGLDEQVAELEHALASARLAAKISNTQDDVDPELRRIANALVDTLKPHLSHVRQQAARAAANHAFREKLEFIRLSHAGWADDEMQQLRNVVANRWGAYQRTSSASSLTTSAPDLYEAAFLEAGLDVVQSAVDQAATWVRNSEINESLIAALDDWARFLPAQSEAADGKSNIRLTRAKLQEIVDAADLSDWRKQLRSALAAGASEPLQMLTSAEVALEQSPLRVAWLGTALRVAKKPEIAIVVLQAANQRHQDDFWLSFELGLNLLEQGNVPEGLDCARAALAMRPSHVDAFIGLAGTLVNCQQYAQATTVCREAIGIDPTRAASYYNLGRALQSQNNLQEAVAAYHQAIECNPKIAAAYYRMSRILKEQGQADEATAAWQKAIGIDPTNAIAHCNLGVFLADELGRADQAIWVWQVAMEIDPKLATPHNNLANHLYKQDKLDEAITEYRKSVQLNPRQAGALTNLGFLLSRQGQLDEAGKAYRQAIAVAPNLIQAHVNLAVLLSRQGELDEAIVEYRKIIEIEANNIAAHLNLGIALHGQGRADDAIAEFRRVLTIDPKHYKAQVNLAIVLSEQRKSDEAIAVARGLLAQLPDDPMAHNVLAWTLVVVPDDDGRFSHSAEAVALAGRACRLKPSNTSFLNTRGMALYRAKQWQKAVDALQEARELGSNYPGNWLFLAMSYWQLNEKEKAQEWYDKALAWRESNQAKVILAGFYAEAEELLAAGDSPVDKLRAEQDADALPLEDML